MHLTRRALGLACLLLGLGLTLAACGSDVELEETKIEHTITALAIGDDPAVCRTLATPALIEAKTGGSGGEALTTCEERVLAGEDDAESIKFQKIELDGSEARAVVSYTGGGLGGQGIEIVLKKAGERWQESDYRRFTHLDKDGLAKTYRKLVEAVGATRAQGRCVVRHMRRASKLQLEEEILDGYSPTLRLSEYEGCPP